MRNYTRKFLPILLGILCSLALTFPAKTTFAVGASSDPDWQPVDIGIDYREFSFTTTDGPIRAYVTRMERANPNVIISTSLAQGKLYSGRETVSDMALRYDQAINTWGDGWGNRNRVAVAINGSFFNMSNGVPVSGQIEDGWYIKRFDDLGGGSGFAWKMDRSIFIGKCVSHRPDRQVITYGSGGNTQLLDGVNVPRGSDQLILYTPQYDQNTHTNNDGAEVLVEMTRPTSVLPAPSYANGYVREIRSGKGSSLIPFDYVVLSANGKAVDTLLSNVKVGTEVRISQEITQYESNCSTPAPSNWTKTYASLSSSFDFLLDGQTYSFTDPGATSRQPRTAIAYNDSYIFFIVVDGRNAKYSVGMTIDELAIFAKDILGATWGINQDGGGSSTMVIHDRVVNQPAVPCFTTYTPLIDQSGSQAPQPSPGYERPRATTPINPYCERPVANGLMMVVVEARQLSSAFNPNESVRTTGTADIRLGPGTEYGLAGQVAAGTPGIIQPDLNNLNGVFAKGTYWWNVSFGSISGWVSERVVEHPQSIPTPQAIHK